MLLLVKLASFVTSLFPLQIYLHLNYSNTENIILSVKRFNLTIGHLVWILSVIQILSIAFLVISYLLLPKNNTTHEFIFEDVVMARTNTSQYLLSNVLPIISLSYESFSSVIFSLVIVVLVGIMYVKNDLYYINPLYDILNVKVYTAKITRIDGDKEIPYKKTLIISTKTILPIARKKYVAVEKSTCVIVVKD